MNVAIIGAGISGLSAARELRSKDVNVKIFDKSRGVGGRMSTRYASNGDANHWEFDHGAQFFTVQDPAFKAEIDQAVKDGVVAPWDARAVYLKSGEIYADNGRDRFVGTPRMNSLPKYWARDLNIELGRRIQRVVKGQGNKDESWTLEFEDGSIEAGFDAIISTVPPAQAELILPKGFAKMPSVKAAEMHVCFCLMVGLSAPLNTDWDTLRVNDLPINWIAVNSAKPGRKRDVGTLVIHSAPEWSDEHSEADRDWVQRQMLQSASALVGMPLDQAPHIALHRWLYSSSKASPDVPCLRGDKIMVAGDWCLGGRVQGAWLSGRAAARALL